jgi:hypothetical protein
MTTETLDIAAEAPKSIAPIAGAMSTQNDGGPAFPRGAHPQWNEYSSIQTPSYTPQSGMTLRDYFAAAALTGLCTHVPAQRFPGQVIARMCYARADAMLAERAKGRS